MGGKRGQVALEFMLTYGWAIFVLLGTVAALTYFGVFDLGQFLTEKCVFSSGVVCVDHLEREDGVFVVIQNGMGIDIINVSLQIIGCSNIPLTLAQLDSGSQTTFSDTCVLPQGDPFRSTMVFNYTNPDSLLEHSKRGELVGRVQ